MTDFVLICHDGFVVDQSQCIIEKMRIDLSVPCFEAIFIDKEFIESSGKIGVHPNDNTATVWLKIEDLINIIKEHGNEVEIVEI